MSTNRRGGVVSHYVAAAATAAGALGVRAVLGPQWGGHAPLLVAVWGATVAGRFAPGRARRTTPLPTPCPRSDAPLT